jgi:hypothetical protein
MKRILHALAPSDPLRGLRFCRLLGLLRPAKVGPGRAAQRSDHRESESPQIDASDVLERKALARLRVWLI